MRGGGLQVAYPSTVGGVILWGALGVATAFPVWADISPKMSRILYVHLYRVKDPTNATLKFKFAKNVELYFIYGLLKFEICYSMLSMPRCCCYAFGPLSHYAEYQSPLRSWTPQAMLRDTPPPSQCKEMRDA